MPYVNDDATSNDATSPSADHAHRKQAIRQINEKRAFWRHVSAYSVLNLAFWISWVIGGLREEWVAPWPLIPTVVWGLFILYREHELGGAKAISHETIDLEIEELRHPNGPVFRDKLAPRPILFGDGAAYQPIRPFHLQDVIDAREQRDNTETSQTA